MVKLLDLLASGAANHAELEGPLSIVEVVGGRQRLTVKKATGYATQRKPPRGRPEFVHSIGRKWHGFRSLHSRRQSPAFSASKFIIN